jgi:hypothetical protein
MWFAPKLSCLKSMLYPMTVAYLGIRYLINSDEALQRIDGDKLLTTFSVNRCFSLILIELKRLQRSKIQA